MNNANSYGVQFAVDGLTFASEIQTFITQHEYRPWLQVEFSYLKRVTGITLTTRLDCCGDRFLYVGVHVGNIAAIDNELSSNPMCYYYPGPTTNGNTIAMNCGTPLIGKYLLIQMRGSATDAILEIAELVVHGENVKGVLGTVTSSHIWTDNPLFGPRYAIDGRISQESSLLQHSFHSYDEPFPWFQMELDVVMEVSKVILIGRIDCCDYRLVHVTVTVGNQLAVVGQMSTNPICAIYQGPASSYGAVIELDCTTPLTGKYVIVQIRDPGNHILEFNQISVDAVRKCKLARSNCIQLSPMDFIISFSFQLVALNVPLVGKQY